MLETLEMSNFNPSFQEVYLPHPTEVSGPKEVIKPQPSYLGIPQFWGPRRLT